MSAISALVCWLLQREIWESWKNDKHGLSRNCLSTLVCIVIIFYYVSSLVLIVTCLFANMLFVHCIASKS